MKKKFLKMLADKQAKRDALNARAQKSEDVAEVRGFMGDIEDINAEIRELEGMIEEIEVEERAAAAGNGDPEVKDPAPEKRDGLPQAIGSFNTGDQDPEKRNKILAAAEARGADLRAGKAVEISYEETAEERAVNVTGGTLIQETKYKGTLAPKFSEVSSLIDRVKAEPLNGGNSYEAGFEVSDGDGDYTSETGDYNEDDPVFGYVTIGKAKITAYTEITDEASVLPNVDYQARVISSVRNALRKKITKQILTGDGAANHLTGIFLASNTGVMPLTVDIDISAIDADTLDTIIYAYGGDEDVEGGAVLILNKLDLAAFAAVRGSDGQKLYEITKNGNTGTIGSKGGTTVDWIINSAAPALSAAGTVVDTYCMAYGMVQAYEMPIFSGMEIQESKDFKFKSGQVAYRGRVWAGGNVTMYKGFSRVKKVAAV